MARCKTMTLYEGMIYHLTDYPNFAATGSIRGMKRLYYGENALLVKCGSYIYNVPPHIYDKAH